MIGLIDDSEEETSYDQEEIEELLAIEIFENYRLPEVKRLPGNIGYIKLDQFLPPTYADGYGERVAACFELISDTDALILDLGNNVGGYAEGSALWISYFFPPETEFVEEIARTPGQGLEIKKGKTFNQLKGERYLE